MLKNLFMSILRKQNYPLQKVNATHLYEIVIVNLQPVYQSVISLFQFKRLICAFFDMSQNILV